MEKNQVFFRVHAIQRMFERNVSAQDVSQALQLGETIEDYSGEMPEPSRLILAVKGRRPLHVVTSENQPSNEVTVITVYIPDPEKWSKDFRSRKS